MCNTCPSYKRRRQLLGNLVSLPLISLAMITPSNGAAHQTTDIDEITQPEKQTPESYLKRARQLANLSIERGEGTRYGAVIVRDGEIIGEGRNRTILLNDPTAHSEVDAIRDACSRIKSQTLEGAEIYCSAPPCPMCNSAIYWARLNKIIIPSSAASGKAIKPTYSTC